MSEPKPTDIRHITGIKQIGRKTTVFFNGEEFEVPTRPIIGTLDLKTGIATVLDSRGNKTGETVNFVTGGILESENKE